MRHVRMLGLCLVAVLTVAAVAASSALAGNPEWGKCVAKEGGKYEDSNCQVKAKGSTGKHSYEWLKASQVAAERQAKGKSANVPFSGGSVNGGGVLTTNGRGCYVGNNVIRTTRQNCKEEDIVEEPTYVECSNETNTGETEGKNKVADVKVVFTGCVVYGSIPCSSEGKKEGEIETSQLKGELGWISKSSKEVGVMLEPAAKHGRFATFKCSADITISVGVGNKKEGAEFTNSGCYGTCPGTTPAEESHGGYDEILSPITPVDQMTSKFEQVYAQESAFPYNNLPTKFEGKHFSSLEAYVEYKGIGSTDWGSAGEVITNVNTPEEAGEIKA